MHASIDARYIRERPSGIGEYVRALVDRVPAMAPADRFSLWVDPRAERPLSRAPNVREALVNAPANSVPTLLWPARLFDLSDVDVLHAPFNLLGRGVPCASVVTVHDLTWLLTPAASEGLSIATPFQAVFYRNGIVRALRAATRIVSISSATADAIRLVSPEASSRIRVVHHGVHARFTRPADPERARSRAAEIVGTADPYLLVVGQNAPSKNHAAVLEAFAAAELGNVRLVLLQRLYPKGALARRARELGIEDRVLFRSSVTQDDVVTLLQSALALVQFSRFEGFGMPVLEAMAAGTPVVASDIPALVEVLGGAGITVPLDPARLAGALRRVASEPSLREELSAKGVERARAFSWERCAESHLEVYREAAKQGAKA